jgi:hypothetical protein
VVSQSVHVVGREPGRPRQTSISTTTSRSSSSNVAHDNGLGISDSYEIDRNGAIREKSHKLRNTLIGAGIAGSMFIPGVGPALLSGLSAAGHGIAAGATALGHGAATLGSKAASFLGFGGHAADPMAATLSAEGNSPWLAGAGELAGETGGWRGGHPGRVWVERCRHGRERGAVGRVDGRRRNRNGSRQQIRLERLVRAPGE